jgi:hypothetical protein
VVVVQEWSLLFGKLAGARRRELRDDEEGVTEQRDAAGR